MSWSSTRTSPYAHLGLSRSYLKRRRGKAALRAARAAVGLKYHFPAAHYFLGIARQQARDLSGAIESFELAIAQNPNFAEAHARLARIYDRHVSNYDLSAEHRRLAQEIRQERRRVRRTKLISELPTLDDALIDEHLPELPDPTRPASLKPPLGAAPVTSEKTHTASGNGQPFVTVVSGLPRSGTSMMMQMLAAGGLTPLADDTRQADESNPRGYFELAKVKALASDNTWLDQAEGKAIKVVVPLVPYLPQEQSYRLVFMRRNLKEILASQASMLGRLKREGGKLTDSRLRGTLSRQVQQVGGLLRAHKVPVLTVDYTEALERPKETADKVAGFLGMELDRDAMTQTVDPTLYRERAQQERTGTIVDRIVAVARYPAPRSASALCASRHSASSSIPVVGAPRSLDGSNCSVYQAEVGGGECLRRIDGNTLRAVLDGEARVAWVADACPCS